MKPDEAAAIAVDATTLLPLQPHTVIQFMHAICRDDVVVPSSVASPRRSAAETALFTPSFKRAVLESCNAQLHAAEDCLRLQVTHERLGKLSSRICQEAFHVTAVPPGVDVGHAAPTACLVPFVAQALVAALRMCDNTW